MVEKVDNIMIGLRIEDDAANRLRGLGLKYVYRTKQEQEKMAAFYGQGFKRNSAYRGHPLVDSADAQLFTEDGQDNVCFGHIIDDLKNFGYRLVIAEILRNEGRGSMLRLFFNREKGNVYLELGLLKDIGKILRRVQRRVFGYFHEEALTSDPKTLFSGSIINLNASMGYLNQEKQKGESIQDIRVIDEIGRVQCQPREEGLVANLRREFNLPDTKPQPLATESSVPAGDAQ